MKSSWFLALAAATFVISARAATAENAGPAKVNPSQPPSFVTPPSKDGASSSPKIDPVARGIVQVQHSRWVKGTGTGLGATLSFAGGHPTLLLVTDVDAPVHAKRHLEQAVIEACQFLVSDKTFDTAAITIARVNPKNPAATKTETTVVHRDSFQKAVNAAGKSPKLAASLAKLRGNDAAIHQAYLELGFK